METIAALATIIGTLVSVIALIQSKSWLVLSGGLLLCASAGVGWYARQQRLTVNAASTVIEGHSIDSLNIANLRRRVNRTFVIQEAHHTARIRGEDLEIVWMYSGYCRASTARSMEFSIDSEKGTPFATLACIAYDLGRDPDKSHPIRPVLVGADGISKKISVPFLEPLRSNQPFRLLLQCSLPKCINVGFNYYTSTLSFAQARIPRCVVHLLFEGAAPAWMRVYESGLTRTADLVKTLPVLRRATDVCEYFDVIENRPGQSARVYAFWLDGASSTLQQRDIEQT